MKIKEFLVKKWVMWGIVIGMVWWISSFIPWINWMTWGGDLYESPYWRILQFPTFFWSILNGELKGKFFYYFSLLFYILQFYIILAGYIVTSLLFVYCLKRVKEII